MNFASPRPCGATTIPSGFLAVEAGADVIALKLRSCHPDQGDGSCEDAVRTVERVLAAVPVPLIVYGPGSADKDNEVLVAVAEKTKGEQLALGLCEDKNYRTIVAAALGNGHAVIAQTPIDVNLAKQLNIPYINLKYYNVNLEIVRRLPENQARRFRAVVLEERNGMLLVGMADPTDLNAADEIARIVKSGIDVAVVTEGQLLESIDRGYWRAQ